MPLVWEVAYKAFCLVKVWRVSTWLTSFRGQIHTDAIFHVPVKCPSGCTPLMFHLILDGTGMKSLRSLFQALSLGGEGGERGKYNPLSVYKSMLVFSSCFLLMDWKCIFWKRKWTKHDPRYNAENFDLKRIAVPFHRACYQVYGQKFTFPFPAC